MKSKNLNLGELAKMAGLHKFKCKCGRVHVGIPALKEFFKIVLTEVSKGRKINISGFGTFKLRSWKPPKNNKLTQKVEEICRLQFRSSKTAKVKMAKIKVAGWTQTEDTIED